MNSIDDIFKTKWVYTAVGQQVVSIDSNGDVYLYRGENSELKDAKIKIIAGNIIYSEDNGKYYWVSDNSISQGFYYKEVISSEYDCIAITEDNRIAVIGNEDGNIVGYIDEIYPELQNKKWKDIDISKEGTVFLLTSEEEEQYIVASDGIFLIKDIFPELENVKIKKILYTDVKNGLMAITTDGKIIAIEDGNLMTLSFEKEISDIINMEKSIWETTDGQYYALVGTSENDYEFKPINEVIPELKNKIIKNMNGNAIVTEDGECYLLESNLINIKDRYDELKNMEIKKCIDNESLFLVILTEDGNVFCNFESNSLTLIENNIEDIRKDGNLIIAKNQQGSDGWMYADSYGGALTFPNYYNTDIKTTANFKNVKTVVAESEMVSYILLSDGSLYLCNFGSENNIKLNDKYFAGKKINYINQERNDLYAIDEEFNIYTFYYNGSTNITNNYPKLKEKGVEQISEYLAITNGGKLNCLGYNFSENAQLIVNDKTFIKIKENFALDSDGNLYSLNIQNNEADLISMDEIFDMNNIKVKDMQVASIILILDENGKVYQINEDNVLECLSDNKMYPFYQKEITQIACGNFGISCIDKDGNRYDYGKYQPPI